jgi:hypothetical protein
MTSDDDEHTAATDDHHVAPRVAFHGPQVSAVAPPHVVNPHADQELVWRAGVSTAWGRRRLAPALFVEGQLVADGPDRGTSYAATEVSLGVPFLDRFQLDGHVKVPFTATSRFDWTSGLALNAAF